MICASKIAAGVMGKVRMAIDDEVSKEEMIGAASHSLLCHSDEGVMFTPHLSKNET